MSRASQQYRLVSTKPSLKEVEKQVQAILAEEHKGVRIARLLHEQGLDYRFVRSLQLSDPVSIRVQNELDHLRRGLPVERDHFR